jgi:hypothetical protein
LLKTPDMLRRGFFGREVEQVLRLAGCALVLSAFATTLGWGYNERQQAQAWREQACAYRFADVARRATFLGSEEPIDACDRLQSLGLGLWVSGVAALPTGNDFARY